MNTLMDPPSRPMISRGQADVEARTACRMGPAASAVKRVLDVAMAGLALIVLAPIIAAVAAAVFIAMGRPIIFSQVRPGYRGKLFTLLKFRSMREAFGPDGSPLPDSERLTGLGRFLRKASLDELPQLINILRGDMSLVGPRPLLPEYLPLYTPEQARRHDVPPGLTGWAQVRGRNAVSWEHRLSDDVWYVDNRSLALDLKIVVMTFGKVLGDSGVSAAGHETMPRFLGTGEGVHR